MITVTYTHDLDVNSGVVDEAFYDERTKELTLDLNDRVYRYSNVPLLDALRFEDRSVSVGREVLPLIKRKYGPGEYLGLCDDVRYSPVGRSASPSVTVGSAQNFTPKALGDTNAAGRNTLVADENEVVRLPLSTNAPVKVERKVVVTFESATGDRKTYTTKAADALDAKAQVEYIAEALGVNLTVKEVTVYFE